MINPQMVKIQCLSDAGSPSCSCTDALSDSKDICDESDPATIVLSTPDGPCMTVCSNELLEERAETGPTEDRAEARPDAGPD